MKKILILIVGGLLYFNLSYGQRISEGTSKSGNKEFSVKRSSNQMIVSNKKNVLVKTENKIPDDVARSGLSNLITYNEDEAQRLLTIVKSDFLKRKRPIPSERPFGVFYIGKDGEVLEVDFILSQGTSLTIDDISAIETALKEQFHFKIKQGKLGSAKFVISSAVLRLDQIASK